MKHQESDIQRECIKWFRLRFKEPKYLIFAVPNGGKRNRIEAAIMKAEGVRAGVADLIIISNHKLFFIEMKAAKTVQTETQIEFEKIVNRLGFDYYLCRSFDDFKNVIEKELLTKN